MIISQLFQIHYGQKAFHNKENLDTGKALLISSQATDNGCYGFFEFNPKYEPPFITVPSTGSIGFASVQLFKAGVADDALVLTPLEKYSIDYLFYIAHAIRCSRWRYNYGRKITPTRLSKLIVLTPNEFQSNVSYAHLFEHLYPKSGIPCSAKEEKPYGMKNFPITELFKLERGHFHAIDRLEKGGYPTVSRVEGDNGIVGFYQKPTRAKVFHAGIITISTVTGDAFLQLQPFIATDNVVMCTPKNPLKITSLVYVQALLNKVKWRYSYGRQCYKGNFQKTVIILPVNSRNDIDEDYMETIVTNQPYWKEFEKRLLPNGNIKIPRSNN